METVRHLFLDLEDTIITPVVNGWFNTQLVNIHKIQRFIEDFKPDFIHVFSFAIHNERELHGFDLGTRPMIEARLNRKLSSVPTVDGEILPACCNIMGLSTDYVDFMEMSNFWSKHEAFRLNMRHLWKNAKNHNIQVEVALLDDVVFNESFVWPDLNVSGRIINIDTLSE